MAVKFAHSFTGFKGCFTILTANNLPYPFQPPVNSSSGYNIEEYQEDQKALKARCKLFKMTTTFNRDADKFPFTELEWSQMMMLAYERWDEMDEYE